MIPERGSGEGREGLDGVTNETSCGMGVHSEEERDEEVMSVPESLEGLLTNLGVCSRVHQKHAKKHDMSRDTTNFGIVDLKGCNLSDLSLLNVKEAKAVSRTQITLQKNLLDIMSSHVRNGPEK